MSNKNKPTEKLLYDKAASEQKAPLNNSQKDGLIKDIAGPLTTEEAQIMNNDIDPNRTGCDPHNNNEEYPWGP